MFIFLLAASNAHLEAKIIYFPPLSLLAETTTAAGQLQEEL